MDVAVKLLDNSGKSVNKKGKNESGRKNQSSSQISLTCVEEVKVDQKDANSVEKEKSKIIKNVWLISLAFLFNFIAFTGTASLQSSLNYAEGLGTVSLSIIYVAMVLSALFTPAIFIKRLGCKWTICFSIIGYVTYPLANFYPRWGTLIPSCVILGVAAAPLWSAKATYLTTVAERYAKLSNETTDAVVHRFFGIFYLMFQLNNIIGQLISSFVLSSGDSTNLVFPKCYNTSYIDNYCGSRDCQDDYHAARLWYNISACPVTQLQSSQIDNVVLYTLMGIYAGSSLLAAAIVGIFVDSIPARSRERKGFFDLLVATFKQLANRQQLLLICITIFSGMEQAFLTGDYTRSFVSCPLAVNWIGFVLICYGACDSICSLLFGKIEKYTGRISLFSFAFLIFVILIAIFQSWIPYPTNPVLFFLFPAFWGVADAVWQINLNGFYGVLFISNQEAGFANYRLWEAFGFAVSFAYQSSLCVDVKLWLMLAVLLIGMLFYYILEYLVAKTERRSSTMAEDVIIQKADSNIMEMEIGDSFLNKSL